MAGTAQDGIGIRSGDTGPSCRPTEFCTTRSALASTRRYTSASMEDPIFTVVVSTVEASLQALRLCVEALSPAVGGRCGAAILAAAGFRAGLAANAPP